MKIKRLVPLSSEIGDNADKQNILRRLRDLRLRCRLSMRELAKQVAVAPSYVSGIEHGRISPTRRKKTVKVHRGRVMQKMGVTSVAELVRLNAKSEE